MIRSASAVDRSGWPRLALLSILPRMGRPGLEDARTPGPESSDEAVRFQIAQGDRRAALALLMEQHGDTVYRYCAALLRDRQQAEDMLQTVFLDAFQSLATFQGRSTFKTWLLGIARHRCLDGIRKRTRWQRLFGLGPSPGRTAGQDDAAAARVAAPGADAGPYADPQWGPVLEDCLGHLPPGARDGVILRFRQELSFQEIAAISGDTPGALRVRVFRAIETLRRCLEKKGVATS